MNDEEELWTRIKVDLDEDANSLDWDACSCCSTWHFIGSKKYELTQDDIDKARLSLTATLKDLDELERRMRDANPD